MISPQIAASAAQVLATMMSGRDAPPAPAISGAPVSSAFHADGWVVSTGKATANGGRIGEKGGISTDASGTSAALDGSGIALPLLAVGAVVAVAVLARRK